MRTTTRPVEWITLMLVVATYAGIVLIITHYAAAPWQSIVFLTVLLAFHASLVHEIIHGHPTSIGWFNDMLASPPLTLIYPYAVFKDSHLAHHNDSSLTLPGIDPESFFHSRQSWETKSPPGRALAWVNMTLLGRLTLNPLISLAKMTRLCAVELCAGSGRQRLVWITHIIACGLLLTAISLFGTIPVWVYLLCAYGAHSLISLRSFFEHRAAELCDHRIVIVDGNRFFNLLFLNNNFHATHHRHPGLPWYEVEKRFRQEGGVVLERNGQFYYPGYRKWLRYLVRPVTSPIHPFSG